MARSDHLHIMLVKMQKSRVMFQDEFYTLFSAVLKDVEAHWKEWQPMLLEELMCAVKKDFRTWEIPEPTPEAWAYLAPKAAELIALCEKAYLDDEKLYRQRLAEERAELEAEERAFAEAEAAAKTEEKKAA